MTAQLYEEDPTSGELDYSKPVVSDEKHLTNDGEQLEAEEGFHVVWHLSTSQEEGGSFDPTYMYTGGISACPDDPLSEENCYFDWGTKARISKITDINKGKSDATVVATDGENWALTYTCYSLYIRVESAVISSKAKTLSEEHLNEAKATLLAFIPDFDLETLVNVVQGDNNCKYPEF